MIFRRQVTKYHGGYTMVMTRKEFVAVAAILSKVKANHEVVREFVEFFKTTNENFDSVRFISACHW